MERPPGTNKCPQAKTKSKNSMMAFCKIGWYDGLWLHCHLVASLRSKRLNNIGCIVLGNAGDANSGKGEISPFSLAPCVPQHCVPILLNCLLCWLPGGMHIIFSKYNVNAKIHNYLF